MTAVASLRATEGQGEVAIALIKCWACGHQVSDNAVTCAGCGAPIAREKPGLEAVGATAEPRDTDSGSEQQVEAPHTLSRRLA